ncbi:hypothetical protein C3L33_21375, partial [Rhododendron williamsianum]
GVLDLSIADPVWVSPRNYLCCLCHHQELISPPAASIVSQGEDLRSNLGKTSFLGNGGDGYLKVLMRFSFCSFVVGVYLDY